MKGGRRLRKIVRKVEEEVVLAVFLNLHNHITGHYLEGKEWQRQLAEGDNEELGLLGEVLLTFVPSA